MLSNTPSDVARILWQIQQEYQASKCGLEGLASGISPHDFISAKTENIGKHHDLVGPEQAISLIARTHLDSRRSRSCLMNKTRAEILIELHHRLGPGEQTMMVPGNWTGR